MDPTYYNHMQNNTSVRIIVGPNAGKKGRYQHPYGNEGYHLIVINKGNFRKMNIVLKPEEFEFIN